VQGKVVIDGDALVMPTSRADRASEERSAVDPA